VAISPAFSRFFPRLRLKDRIAGCPGAELELGGPRVMPRERQKPPRMGNRDAKPYFVVREQMKKTISLVHLKSQVPGLPS
jgi:hypothetical protein